MHFKNTTQRKMTCSQFMVDRYVYIYEMVLHSAFKFSDTNLHHFDNK